MGHPVLIPNGEDVLNPCFTFFLTPRDLGLGLGLGLVNIKMTKNVLFKAFKLSINQGSTNINKPSVSVKCPQLTDDAL